MVSKSSSRVHLYSYFLLVIILVQIVVYRKVASTIKHHSANDCLVFTCRGRDPTYLQQIHTNMVHGHCMEADFQILRSELNGKNLTNDHFCVAEVLYRLLKRNEFDIVIFRDLDTRFSVKKMISRVQTSAKAIVAAYNDFHTEEKQNVITNLIGFKMKELNSTKLEEWLSKGFFRFNSDQAPFNRIFKCERDIKCYSKEAFNVDEVHCRSRMREKREFCMKYGYLPEHGEM